MNTETHINKPTFLTISILTILLNGLMAIMNLREFYQIGILNKTEGFPFGGEGSAPYYYKTTELYSAVNLIWGLFFLTLFILAIRTYFKGQQKNIFWILGLTVLFIFGQFIHGQIGT